MNWFFVWISLMLAPEGAASPQCAGCHRAEADAHAKSRHTIAWTNPLLRGEYDPNPKPWCVRCHAPDVAPLDRAAPPSELAEVGVSCAGCHVREGNIVARSKSPRSIHNTRLDPELGSAEDCARCHQFNFPVLSDAGTLTGSTNVPMQNTVAEAKASGGSACSSCHDPHRAPGSHSIEMLRLATTTSLCRTADRVELTIANLGAGHNLPTGGVHRYMTASIWRSSAPAKLAELRLGREFGPGFGDSRKTIRDTTIEAGKSRTLTANARRLGGDPNEPINAEIRYHYAVKDGAVLADGSPAVKSVERLRVPWDELSSCPE